MFILKLYYIKTRQSQTVKLKNKIFFDVRENRQFNISLLIVINNENIFRYIYNITKINHEKHRFIQQNNQYKIVAD